MSTSKAAAHPVLKQLVLKKELGLRDLVLFNLAALISTRWISVAAHVGPGTIVLWLLAAILFLIPCAFVVAHLAQRYPEEGGLYIWTREAFGEWHGFACSWFYYLNNLFWIPGVLISLVGMTTFAFSEKAGSLAENPYFVLPCALGLLLLIIAANYVGLAVAKWVDNFGGISVYFIAGLLVAAASAAFISHGSATHFNLLPHWDVDKLNFWSQLAMGMTGLSSVPSCRVRSAMPAETSSVPPGSALFWWLSSTCAPPLRYWSCCAPTTSARLSA